MFLNNIESRLQQLCSKYENLIIIGDLNSEMKKEAMGGFCELYNLEYLVKEPTCYKSIDNQVALTSS